MSFFSDASLVYVPSGVKDGKTYSIKPTDGSGDLTFSRGSDIEATRVNANGYIEKAQVNLLLQSNTFNTSWTIVNSAVLTSGQADKDGGTDAWLIASNGTGNAHISQSVTAGVATLSVYAKAGTLNWMRLYVDISGANASAWFNLATGALGTSYNSIEHKIESIGSGWYRCILVVPNGGTVVRINPSVADADVSQTTGNIYIQDAQLNYGLVAQTYQETTTAAVVSGITDNMPRLNYDPANPTCPSLLLEPSRTNAVPFSEYLSGNTATNSPTITENYAISPEGVQNAFRMQDTTGGTFKSVYKSQTISAGASVTTSVFIKKSTSAVSTYMGYNISFSGGTGHNNYAIVDEYNGTATILTDQSGTTAVRVEDYGDYWRFSMSSTDTGSNTSATSRLYVCLSSNGTGVSTGTKDWTGYGWTFEIGSYPTSYIPTYGSSATRTADACSKTGISSLIGQTEGTIFWDMEYSDPDRYLSIADTTGSSNNYLLLWHTSNIPRIALRGSGTNAVVNTISSYPSTPNTRYKYAVSWTSGGNFYVYRNGVQIFSTTIGTLTLSAPFDAIKFADRDDSPLFEGTIYQTLSFTSALSATELATLTA